MNFSGKTKTLATFLKENIFQYRNEQTGATSGSNTVASREFLILSSLKKHSQRTSKEGSMKRRIVLFVCIAIALFACNDKSTDTNDTPAPSFSYETSKCVSHGLPKGTALDSVFTYSFDQNLTMDFSAWANCCPDSGRFVLGYTIRTDTIFITVTDTAQALCKCICPYMIHTQLTNLSLNQYVVRCRIGNGQTFDDPIHLVTVIHMK